MKRIAVCSYWYPPMQAIASLRIGKFVKYLPDFGWEPFVFTVAPRTDRYTRAGTLPDEGLPDHVSRIGDPSVHAVVDRIWPQADRPWEAGPPARWRRLRAVAKRAYNELLRFPDESWPWLLRYPRIRDQVARVEPQVIFSSSPPATTHIIARRLSRDLGVPWVADFRDPWSHNDRLARSVFFKGAETRLERRVMAGASALTTVSPAFRDLLVSLHAKPAFVVPNGFDDAGQMPGGSGAIDDGRIAFVYTGLLYDTTAVPMLFDALDRLVAAGRIDARRVVFRFYGRNQSVAAGVVLRYPRVRPLVELHGEVSHDAAVAAQRAASALLLLEPPEGWAQTLTPGKLFEYIGSGRFIVATGLPGGEVDRLLRETRTGTLVSNVDALATLVAELVERCDRHGAVVPKADQVAVARYTRRNVTARLADVLDGVVRTAPQRRAAGPGRAGLHRASSASVPADEAVDHSRRDHRGDGEQLR